MFDVSVLLKVVLLVFILCFQRRTLQHLLKQLWVTSQQHRSRRWKPQSPQDCPQYRAGFKLDVLRPNTNIRPYSELKSRRGRKKTLNTRGFACPNLQCEYRGVTDDHRHALVVYGSHNGIQRFRCQACSKVFTSPVNTPLYYLKTAPKQVEFVP